MGEQKEGGNGGLRGMGRAFAKEVLVPIALALVVIQFVIQAFKIPSASMEDSLLIGDFLLGIKFVYGSPIPFSEKKLPGLSEPRPGDVLIFKYPGDPLYPGGDRERYRFLANLFLFGNLYWDRQAPEGEKRLVWYSPKDFIKRCVARSGQRIQVSGTRLLVDGQESPLPPKGKFKPQPRGYEPQRDSLDYRLPMPGETFALDTLTLERAAWIRSLAHQENPGRKVELLLDFMKDTTADSAYVLPFLSADPDDPMQRYIYHYLKLDYSQAYHEGTPYFRADSVPFSVFREAARTGFLSVNHLMFPPGYPDTSTFLKRVKWRFTRRQEYGDFFMGHFLNLVARNVAWQGQQSGVRYWIRARLSIDGAVSGTYTVKDKCYFMMGDNRDHSSDSRYFGLLSANYVKAKAFIIYFSIDNEDKAIRLLNPITWLRIPFRTRWTRIGKLID